MALRTITSEPRATDSSPAAGRRTELAAFLRSRRERIRPDEVGLPPGGRRRTPGLRREEVAHLAGVGVTWYTWLEQGRDINVSTQVLDAISRTLRLDRLERNHLYTLAGVPIAPGAVECSVLTRPALRILEQLAPYPASVLNRRYDVLACNAAYRKIFIDLDEIPVEDRNLLWLVFTVKQWNCSFLDHDDLHEALVAGFRANMAQHIGEPAWGDLVERLLDASPEFADLWSRHDVAGPGTRVKLVDSPDVGVLRLEPSNLWVGQGADFRLAVYAPADDETEAKLHKLVEG
ncbi:MAG TPA: helix-turn-helix transcriptional regulator [Kribbellaceae bacterium]|nr:helix-turn-helix transcriptional regulator [Kribbellaceae bacterium]